MFRFCYVPTFFKKDHLKVKVSFYFKLAFEIFYLGTDLDRRKLNLELYCFVFNIHRIKSEDTDQM